MRKLTLSLVFLLAASMLVSGQDKKGFFPYAYETHTLPNKLSSILIPMKGSGLVAYYTIVRTGSRDEWEPGRSGFAHFFEHMMFRGTEKYPAAQYQRLISEMGADNNAYTTDDYTCYTGVIPGSSLETMMDLESDRFQNLQYAEEAFRTEAGAVYGEYRKNRTNPWSVAYEEISNVAFDNHTYKHTTMGFERDIKEMPNMFDYSRSFFERYYRPENCIVMIVGDFDAAAVKPMLEKYYGDWKPGYVEPEIKQEPSQTAERTKQVKYDGQTLPLVWMGYKGAKFDPASKAVASAYLLGDLAFGENSDIYKQLVIRESKVQFVSADFGFNRDPKLYDIYTMVKSEDDLDYVKGEIDKTIAKFKTDLVSTDQLENLKKRNRYGYLMALDTPSRVASNLARFIALGQDIEVINKLYATIATLTPEDIRDAANKFLNKEQRTIITLKGES
ncbi:MAG: M16 family metallopeptidase [Calditrichia bacterium]